MIFNSFAFWAFFALVVALYWRLPHRAQNVLLLVSSYVFYSFWDWRFLGLLLASTLVDFFISNAIDASTDKRRRKLLLLVSMVGNLTFLGFFKYYGFFVEQFAAMLAAFGFQPHIAVLNIVLPVGISFYTFQTMSYTIDVYRGQFKPSRNLIDVGVFIAYFPQLVAGPIERAHDLLPQIQKPRTFRWTDMQEGLYHVLLGLFKKVVVADNLAVIANRVFATPSAELQSLDVVVGVVAFALQIYGDFSGYSSIAQGVSRWMGIELSFNFRMPYFSRTPSEFWQRWHITLSSWLRDYLYIPLGGNRLGPVRTYVNLILTMLLGGLWHGAAWTYVFWGAWQGLLLVGYRLAGVETTRDARLGTLRSLGYALVMFCLVCIGWIFFRASSLSHALAMIGGLFAGTSDIAYSLYATSLMLFFAGPLFVYEWFVYRSGDMLLLLRKPLAVQVLVYLYLVLMLLLFPPLTPQIFIYFQF